METAFLTIDPDEMALALRRDAEKKQKKNRLRVRAGEREFKLRELSENGFVVEDASGKHLRGLVDLYDGSKHLAQCLIVCARATASGMAYEFKRRTRIARNHAPDYVVSENAPVALLTR